MVALRAGLVGLLLCAGPVWAADWYPLTGAQITATLERHILRHDDGSEQQFNYGGLTDYRRGWPNEGHWRVTGDRYCSQWPPQTLWRCYDVAASGDGKEVRFTDADGRVTLAVIEGEME